MPGQEPVVDVGVTIYCTVPAVEPGLVSVWLMVEPLPAVAPVTPPVIVPIVHEKLLGMLAVKPIFVPVTEQIVVVAGGITVGEGLTVMVKVLTRPVQPLAVAVTDIVAVTGVVPLLVAVNAGILSEPLVPKPIFALLVQAKLAPVVALPKLMVAPLAELQ